MAGIQNNIVFGNGIKITVSDAQSIQNMQSVNSVSIVNFSGNPETNVSANLSSISHDTTTGNIYVKTTGTGNTGWTLINVNPVTNVTTSFSTAQFTGTNVKNINFALDNLIIGSAGAFITTASNNVGYGFQNLRELTTGIQNCSVGYNSMINIKDGSTSTGIGTSVLYNNISGVKNVAVGQNSMVGALGSNNTCVGAETMSGSGTGSQNACLGYQAGFNLTDGIGNVLLGSLSMVYITTGSYNIAIGNNAGNACITGTESGNIYLNNVGVNAESNATRVGNNSTTKCFIAGIASVATSNSQSVTIDSVTGQLGSTPIVSSGFITINGTLTSSQIKNLRGSPIVIVPSQGVGKVIRLIACSGKLNYGGSNAFAGSNNILIFPEANLTNSLATVLTSALITASSTQYFLGQVASVQGLNTIFENLGIQISISTATEITGNASNNNSVSYSVTYQVLSI